VSPVTKYDYSEKQTASWLPNNGQKYFVNGSRSILRSYFLVGKTSSYICRIFFVGNFYQQSMYIDGDIDTRTCNNFQSGKETLRSYSGCL